MSPRKNVNPIPHSQARRALPGLPQGMWVIVDCPDVFLRESCFPGSQINDMRISWQLPAGTKLAHILTGARAEIVQRKGELVLVERRRWDRLNERRQATYIAAWQERHNGYGGPHSSATAPGMLDSYYL